MLVMSLTSSSTPASPILLVIAFILSKATSVSTSSFKVSSDAISLVLVSLMTAFCLTISIKNGMLLVVVVLNVKSTM